MCVCLCVSVRVCCVCMCVERVFECVSVSFKNQENRTQTGPTTESRKLDPDWSKN